MNKKCPYCNSDSDFKSDPIVYEYNCPTCGTFAFLSSNEPLWIDKKNKIASYLFYTKDRNNRFLGSKDDYETVKSVPIEPEYNLITLDEIEAFYPKTFSEKITNILLWLDSHTSYLGKSISITREEFYSLAFIDRFISNDETSKQFDFLHDYLYYKKQYIDFGGDSNVIIMMIKSEGYERIEELQLDKQNNKKVFVSMAFNSGTDGTRNAIKHGIIQAGYDATLIDEIIHNKQIVPEMLRLIRESRILVMDISDPNYGAYYEAGYAQGLGKEVIITCSNERFHKKYETEEEKKYEKYLKPHFDIAQKQILVWRDEKDLTNKLSEWIKAIE